MPKPLGFYGLKIDADIEKAIDNAGLVALIDAFEDTANAICDRHYYNIPEEDLGTLLPSEKIFRDHQAAFDTLTDMGQIGLIRALCDRIEQRLMEQAK